MVDWNALIKDFSDSQLRVGEIISQVERAKYKRPVHVEYVASEDNIKLFKCDDCGKWNNYWHRLCSECDYKQDMEVDEYQQDERNW